MVIGIDKGETMRRVACLVGLALMVAGCGVPPASVEPLPSHELSLIPALYPPADMGSGGGGGGGGFGGEGFELNFSSGLNLLEVHGHFAEQLAEAGWQPVDEQAEAGLMTTYWELVDEEGTSWAARLSLSERAEAGEGAYLMEIKLILPR